MISMLNKGFLYRHGRCFTVLLQSDWGQRNKSALFLKNGTIDGARAEIRKPETETVNFIYKEFKLTARMLFCFLI